MLIAAKAELEKREIEGWVVGLQSEFVLKDSKLPGSQSCRRCLPTLG